MRCSQCLQDKAENQFYRYNGRGTRKRQARCKVCDLACSRARTKRLREEEPEKHRLFQKEKRLKQKYGMTLEQYDQLVTAQKGSCACCGDAPKLLHVDHCHETGKIRALLCQPCNLAVGFVKEDEARVLKLLEYVRRL